MKSLFISTLPVILFLTATLAVCEANPIADNPEIQSWLRDRVDRAKQCPGIIVGIVDASGSGIVSYGKSGAPAGDAVDGDTVFEIGSATKVFTSLLLADMAEHGELKLDDPISKYLPESVKVPSRNGRQITLVDLATHTSGLPRMPDNFAQKDPENPYADYTVPQLYAFLSGYTLPRDIGADYEYSNLGGGLLGHVLALCARTNYESLVLERICRPLGMTNTEITLSPDLKRRLAAGHNAAGQPAKNWDLPALAGAGALRSTANDLLKFVRANIGLSGSNLLPAMHVMQQSRHSAGSPYMDVGLGWHIARRFDTVLIWHNGGTGGYHSFMGFDPQSKRGVVVLANSANSIDDLGFHILEPKYPLTSFKPPKSRVAIQLPLETLDRCVGSYKLAPGVFFTLRREGSHLMAQLTGQSYFEIFPESDTEFFYKVVDAQLSFTKDSAGKLTGLVLHQNGMNQPATRVSEKAAE
ncbi:MAG TPA: serine hydrolase [Verrucomicrobiae bacterium]|nr:serine hydrolase [Verrucomicrobiae bacterium]